LNHELTAISKSRPAKISASTWERRHLDWPALQKRAACSGYENFMDFARLSLGFGSVKQQKTLRSTGRQRKLSPSASPDFNF
jgi:hypothetical protein